MFQTKSGRQISYNGHEFSSEIKRTKEGAKIHSLDELFENLLDVWCRETAYPRCQHDYVQDNDPTYGQCAVTATLVHDMFGGTIHKIKVDGGGTHYFNKIDDCYIDLTSDQFDLYNIPLRYEPNTLIPREYCGKNADTQKRFTLLVKLLSEKING